MPKLSMEREGKKKKVRACRHLLQETEISRKPARPACHHLAFSTCRNSEVLPNEIVFI